MPGAQVKESTLGWLASCVSRETKAGVLKLLPLVIPAAAKCTDEGAPSIREAAFGFLVAAALKVCTWECARMRVCRPLNQPLCHTLHEEWLLPACWCPLALGLPVPQSHCTLHVAPPLHSQAGSLSALDKGLAKMDEAKRKRLDEMTAEAARTRRPGAPACSATSAGAPAASRSAPVARGSSSGRGARPSASVRPSCFVVKL